MRLLLYIISLMFAAQVLAEFTITEILVIPWGDGQNELKIALPHGLDDQGTPLDYSDDTYEILGGGPSQGFVDEANNIYFSSYEHGYLKAFDQAGRLILNFSPGQAVYDTIIGNNSIDYFCVDSLARIYILKVPDRPYVAVIDTMGDLIDKLNPDGIGSGVGVLTFDYNSKDRLTFLSSDKENYLYENGEFIPGASSPWLAVDDYYYSCKMIDLSNLRFVKYSDPDINAHSNDLTEVVVPYGSSILHANLLGVDDNLRLFVFITESATNARVQIYSTSYELADEIVLAPCFNKYHWCIWPFVRADGTIYEFRCLDDGLHVIRWSKE